MSLKIPNFAADFRRAYVRGIGLRWNYPEARAATDDIVSLLAHAIYRNHDHSDSCDACERIAKVHDLLLNGPSERK